jgi:undecaprenyl-diphosphatase
VTAPSDAASGAVSRFDAAVDQRFDAVRGHKAVDRVMYSLSELGDFSLIWHTASVALAAFGDHRAERAAVRLSTALAVESIVVNGVIKGLVRRERPAATAERPHRLRQPSTSSFPSGHASAAACAFVLLTDGASPMATAGWATIATLVALSRVHVQIHHASDVAGGAVIGAGIGLGFRRWPIR